MNKKHVIEQIQSHLVEELAELLPLAQKAEAEAKELDAESARRIGEIQQQLVMYRFLPMRDFGAEDVACPSALVELDLQGRRAFYLIVPTGGGLVMKVDEHPVQVITPQSPLGEALMGHKAGDAIQVLTQGKSREYKVISVR